MSVARLNAALNSSLNVANLRPRTLMIVLLALNRLKVIATELDARGL